MSNFNKSQPCKQQSKQGCAKVFPRMQHDIPANIPIVFFRKFRQTRKGHFYYKNMIFDARCIYSGQKDENISQHSTYAWCFQALLQQGENNERGYTILFVFGMFNHRSSKQLVNTIGIPDKLFPYGGTIMVHRLHAGSM